MDGDIDDIKQRRSSYYYRRSLQMIYHSRRNRTRSSLVSCIASSHKEWVVNR